MRICDLLMAMSSGPWIINAVVSVHVLSSFVAKLIQGFV